MKVKHKNHDLRWLVTNFLGLSFLFVIFVLDLHSIRHTDAAKSKLFRNGQREERLLELYETHQKLCSVNDTQAGQGICIFMWDCHRSGGQHLGLCSIDSAIYGSCCSVPTSGPSVGSEGENEETNTIPVDESSEKTTTTSPVVAAPSTLPGVEVINSPDIEIIPDYNSEEEEHNLEAEISQIGNNSIVGSSDLDTEEQHVLPINQIRCGISMRSSNSSVKKMRIIGGMDSEFAVWPWMVSVRRSSLFGYSSTHSCGGVLINENWVVTAAHCVFALSKSLIRVRFGDFDFKEEIEELPFIERPIEKRVIHPDYNFTSYENDLALLKLQKPVEYSLHISPICLPMLSNDTFIGENGTITGWGRLSEGGKYSQKLQQVAVPILSNSDCMNLFRESGRIENIPDNFICAGYREGGKDGCQGDSGGPLQILNQTDQRWMLAGVMSWGVGCGEPKAPGVYTRITKFTEWILQQIT